MESGDGVGVSAMYTIGSYDSGNDDLARAMPETLSRHENPVADPPATRTRSVGLSKCAGCHGTLSLGFRRILTCLGRYWHPDCFTCTYCRKAIADKQFSVYESDPYHRECHKKLFHPKCEICYDYIPLNARGLIEVRCVPFWSQRYCPQHGKDGSTGCCSCNRVEPVDQRFKNLGDGRKTCSECTESAVMTTKDCQPLYRDVLKYFRSTLGMPIEQEVPMRLVGREALWSKAEKDGHTYALNIRGLCLPESEQILRVSEHGERKKRKLARHCRVTAILVLFGLPRLLTGSILAHELMHAWIRLDGRFSNLQPDVEEGICQVIAHMWLQAELEILKRRSDNGSSSTKRLGEFFLHQIETDLSPIDGDGFRAAYVAVANHGLPRTLHHLRKTGNILHQSNPISSQQSVNTWYSWPPDSDHCNEYSTQQSRVPL